MTDKKIEQSSEALIDELARHYDEAVEALQSAISAFVVDGTKPDRKERREGLFCYPELRVRYRGGGPTPAPLRSFGRLVAPGTYATTVTRPRLFAEYLTEQLDLLIQGYGVTVEVSRSRQEIPFPYVLDPGHDLALEGVSPAELARWFPATELAYIGDEIADGIPAADGELPRPLALFDGLRTDFSLARLRHYTGTPP